MHLNDTATARFWAKVIKSSHCWLWTARVDKDGYGKFRPDGANTSEVNAARVSFVLHGGTIPPEVMVRHTCDNPPCVRPDHLILGTALDNRRDAVERDRIPRGNDHPMRQRPELWQHRWPPAVKPDNWGERNGNARFTPDDIRAIRAAHANGESQGSIARRMGTAQPVISRIVLRKSWPHID